MWVNYLCALTLTHIFILAQCSICSCAYKNTNTEINNAICISPDAKGEEPCQLDDYKCMGEILAANSYCFPTVNPYLPEQFTTVFTYDAPFFGYSVYSPFFTVIGLKGCEVSTFLVYSTAERLLLSIECPVQFESNMTVTKYEAVELPSTFETYSILANVKFEKLTITGDLRHLNELDLCSAFVFPSDGGVPPDFRVTGQDAESQEAIDNNVFQIEGDEDVATSYFLYGLANKLFEEFVQRMICDFSCCWVGKDMHHPGKQNLQYSYLTDQIG